MQSELAAFAIALKARVLYRRTAAMDDDLQNRTIPGSCRSSMGTDFHDTGLVSMIWPLWW